MLRIAQAWCVSVCGACAEGQHPLQFAAPTASERLRWVSEIEGHLGMEAVPLQARALTRAYL
eukprot:6188497-Pleurochrysis_carterae.AAC.1